VPRRSRSTTLFSTGFTLGSPSWRQGSPACRSIPETDTAPSAEKVKILLGLLPGGYPVTAVYGDQGNVPRGWLRRYHPELGAALHLFESLVRNPGLLAEITAAAGGAAITHLGRALAEKHPG
jgi:hypothetical protein